MKRLSLELAIWGRSPHLGGASVRVSKLRTSTEKHRVVIGIVDISFCGIAVSADSTSIRRTHWATHWTNWPIVNLQLILVITFKGVDCFLTITLLSESLEDLLKWSLRNSVLLYVHLLLNGLDKAKEVANGLVLSRHAKLVELTNLLLDLNSLE